MGRMTVRKDKREAEKFELLRSSLPLVYKIGRECLE